MARIALNAERQARETKSKGKEREAARCSTYTWSRRERRRRRRRRPTGIFGKAAPVHCVARWHSLGSVQGTGQNEFHRGDRLVPCEWFACCAALQVDLRHLFKLGGRLTWRVSGAGTMHVTGPEYKGVNDVYPTWPTMAMCVRQYEARSRHVSDSGYR